MFGLLLAAALGITSYARMLEWLAGAAVLAVGAAVAETVRERRRQ